jgi:hypothetical protein
MRYTLALLAAAVAIQASPVALPQAVTASIAPKQPPPPGCTGAYAQGIFGIAVLNISTTAAADAAVKAATATSGYTTLPNYCRSED